MTEAAEVRPEAGRELDRIVFFSDAVFSDAVFAIAITILVLDIRVPDIPPELVARELPGRILDLGPKFLSYVISFLVLAVYWQAHTGSSGPWQRCTPGCSCPPPTPLIRRVWSR
jgi:uncharacterized membrane protein